MNKFLQELKKSKSELKGDLLNLKKELFNLKVQARLNKLEKPSSLRNARRDIARVLTALRSKKEEVDK